MPPQKPSPKGATSPKPQKSSSEAPKETLLSTFIKSAVEKIGETLGYIVVLLLILVVAAAIILLVAPIRSVILPLLPEPVQTAIVQIVAIETSTLTPTALPSSTPSPTPTLTHRLLLTPTLTLTQTPSPSPTNTPTQIPLDTSVPLGFLGNPVTSNEQWTPVVQSFDGVEMVLVPVGCFEMGDNGAGGWQCFDQPFWIDRYEVTNEQFQTLRGRATLSSRWIDTDNPRENITWAEARDFCAKRDARLPTDAEWQYAARGPDALIYPWGNDFEPENTVYAGNSRSRTEAVGSRPSGTSWVGASDMSGNVWEWINTLDDSYPYATDDGRENMGDIDHSRGLRGGAWNTANESLQVVYRGGTMASNWSYAIGFRCVRWY